jgi:hypothetical protein
LLRTKKAAVQHPQIGSILALARFQRDRIGGELRKHFSQLARNHLVSEITVEPITVWAAFGTFVLGVFVGALIVHGEFKRARRRWREATRTWHEIEAVAVELRGENDKLPRHNAPDMVAAIREGVTEQLKKRSA